MGFTLIEIVVALFVMSLTAGLVLVTMHASSPDVVRDAQTLAQHLSLASRESIVTGEPIEVRVNRQGWSSFRYRDADWVDAGSHAFGSKAVEIEATQVAPIEEGDPETPAFRFRFDATGGASPGTLRMKTGSATMRIVVESNGSLEVVQER